MLSKIQVIKNLLQEATSLLQELEQNQNSDEVLTTKEAAKYLGVHIETIKRAVSNSYLVPTGKKSHQFSFAKSDLDTYKKTRFKNSKKQ